MGTILEDPMEENVGVSSFPSVLQLPHAPHPLTPPLGPFQEDSFLFPMPQLIERTELAKYGQLPGPDFLSIGEVSELSPDHPAFPRTLSDGQCLEPSTVPEDEAVTTCRIFAAEAGAQPKSSARKRSAMIEFMGGTSSGRRFLGSTRSPKCRKSAVYRVLLFERKANKKEVLAFGKKGKQNRLKSNQSACFVK